MTTDADDRPAEQSPSRARSGAASPPRTRRRPDRRDAVRLRRRGRRAAARRPAAPAPQALGCCWSRSSWSRTPPGCRSRCLVKARASTAASRRSRRRRRPRPLLIDRRRSCWSRRSSRRSPGSVFLRALRPDRPGHPARAAPAGVPPLPAAEPGVPRPLHLGPGDLPADLRRRRDLRDARDRLRRPGHRRADPGRHRRSCCSSSTSSSAWSRCCAFPFLVWLTSWFRKRVGARPTGVTRETVALVIVHFVESMNGIRAVQAFRREPRNQEIFDDVNDQLPRGQRWSRSGWSRVFMPGHQADRQRHHRRRPALRRLPRLSTARSRSACWRRSCSTCGSSSSRCRRSRSSTTPSSPPSAALEKLSGRARGGARRPRADRPGRRCPTPRGDAALRRRAVRLRRRPAGAARPRPDDPGRPDRRAGRHHRRRQDHASPSWSPGSTTRPTGAVTPRRRRPARRSTDDDLRRAVVMVTQENFLFSGTVADNIRFGRPDADRGRGRGGGPRDRRARLHRRAARGLRHRRRQARRPAVGRAAPAGRVRPGVPRRPGGADPRRGDLVARRPVASGWCSGRCARSWPTAPRVIIAHRLSTVEIADRVLVLEHGRIVEDGSPPDLIAGGDGRYADLHDAWLDVAGLTGSLSRVGAGPGADAGTGTGGVDLAAASSSSRSCARLAPARRSVRSRPSSCSHRRLSATRSASGPVSEPRCGRRRAGAGGEPRPVRVGDPQRQGPRPHVLLHALLEQPVRRRRHELARVAGRRARRRRARRRQGSAVGPTALTVPVGRRPRRRPASGPGRPRPPPAPTPPARQGPAPARRPGRPAPSAPGQ